MCLYCWTKLANFHEFYNAVDQAKDVYLKNTIGNNVLNFITINCDEFDEDILQSVKDEPINDDNDDNVNNVIGDNRTSYREIHTTTVIAENASNSIQDTIEAIEVINDQVHPKQLFVKCCICNHQLRTSSETMNHYRSEHNESSYRMQITKCCGPRLFPSEIYDHIQYHLNSDAFK